MVFVRADHGDDVTDDFKTLKSNRGAVKRLLSLSRRRKENVVDAVSISRLLSDSLDPLTLSLSVCVFKSV